MPLTRSFHPQHNRADERAWLCEDGVVETWRRDRQPCTARRSLCTLPYARGPARRLQRERPFDTPVAAYLNRAGCAGERLSRSRESWRLFGHPRADAEAHLGLVSRPEALGLQVHRSCTGSFQRQRQG